MTKDYQLIEEIEAVQQRAAGLDDVEGKTRIQFHTAMAAKLEELCRLASAAAKTAREIVQEERQEGRTARPALEPQ